MRKALMFGILVIAALALVASAAFACGDKDCKALKTTATATSSVNVHASCQGTAEPAKAAVVQADSQWAVKTICVKGMSCPGNEQAVRAELAKVPGVVEVVKVSHQTCEAVLKVDQSKVQDAQLTKAITDKGYEAEIVPTVAKTGETGSKGPVCPFSGTPGCDVFKKAGADCQAGKAVKTETGTETETQTQTETKKDDTR